MTAAYPLKKVLSRQPDFWQATGSLLFTSADRKKTSRRLLLL
jgi:hypothetical protein